MIKNIVSKVETYWAGLDEETKLKISSAWDTFFSTFITCIFIALEAGIQWTWAFWAGLIGVALRTAWKATRIKYLPTLVGKIKGL